MIKTFVNAISQENFTNFKLSVPLSEWVILLFLFEVKGQQRSKSQNLVNTISQEAQVTNFTIVCSFNDMSYDINL